MVAGINYTWFSDIAECWEFADHFSVKKLKKNVYLMMHVGPNITHCNTINAASVR